MSLSPRPWRRAVTAVAAAAVLLGVASGTAQAATTDAPSSYRSVTSSSAQDTWIKGVLSSVRDVDIYRFTTKTTSYARALLGDLHANYRLRLLDATGGTIATSDRSGVANEEIYNS